MQRSLTEPQGGQQRTVLSPAACSVAWSYWFKEKEKKLRAKRREDEQQAEAEAQT